MPAASASRRPGFAASRRNDLRGASHGGWNYGIVQGFSGIGYRVLLDSRRRIPTIAPLFRAGIAQLVERNLAKVEVASSSLVSRSNIPNRNNGLSGRVVIQRPAKPCTPVRFRP